MPQVYFVSFCNSGVRLHLKIKQCNREMRMCFGRAGQELLLGGGTRAGRGSSCPAAALGQGTCRIPCSGSVQRQMAEGISAKGRNSCYFPRVMSPSPGRLRFPQQFLHYLSIPHRFLLFRFPLPPPCKHLVSPSSHGSEKKSTFFLSFVPIC